MEILKFEDFKGGWFIGDFTPSALKTSQFEVGYHHYKVGQEWDHHFHKQMDEVNLILSGKVKIQGRELIKGDVVVINKYEVSDPEFLEDTEIIIIKIPSVPGDKFKVEK